MRVVLTGASGQLGPYVLETLRAAGHETWAWVGRQKLGSFGETDRAVDVTDPSAVDQALAEADPAVVIHTAAVSTIDGVRRDVRAAWETNVSATARLAEWCDRRGRRLIYTSTDLVFDGTPLTFRENSRPNPLMEYGRTKRAGELAVLGTAAGLVARMTLMYGPARGLRPTGFDRVVAGLRRGEVQTFFDDEFRTPLDLLTSAEILTRLVTSDLTGILHVAGAVRLSRFELACEFARALGLELGSFRANRQADVAFDEPRPADVSLDTTRLAALFPDLRRDSVFDAVRRMMPLGSF